MSEGLESDQWFRHLLMEAHMARSSLKDVEKDSLKRPALVFTDSDSLAKHCQERRWTEPRQKVQDGRVHAPRRVPSSGEHIAAVVADTHASRRTSDEDVGKGHSRLIFQQAKKVHASKKPPQKVFERCVAAKQVSIGAYEI